MRNLKRVLSLTLASVMLLGMMVVGSSAAGYSDVDYYNDNVEAIEVLTALGIFEGDEGTSNFRPQSDVTRAEMAKIMAVLLGLNYQSYEGLHPYTDMVGHWAEAYVAACSANGVINGRGGGVYDPSATVTAIEASAMLMRAMGYFKYASDYADGFEVATVSQGSKIGIYRDISGSAYAPMTRNAVAQLVLNALQCSMVDVASVGTTITTSDGTVINTGSTTYTVRYVTDSINGKSTKISAASRSAGAGTGTGEFSVELGEELYDGKLELRTAKDVFGRPASEWRYNNKTIGTYADEPDLIYTKGTKGKDIWNDLGRPTTSLYVYYQIDGDTAAWDSEGLYGIGSDVSNNVYTTNKGVLTEVYYNSLTGRVDVISIGTYLAKVTSDYNAEDKTLAIEVQSGGLSPKGGSFEGELSGKDFGIDGYKEGDYLIVNATTDGTTYEIQTIAPAPVLAGVTVTEYRTKSNVVVDGKTYDYAYVASDDAAALGYDELISKPGYTLKDAEYNFYLDPYGYIIGVEAVTSAELLTDYLFVKEIDNAGLNAAARAIFMDGTEEIITVSKTKTDGGKMTSITTRANGGSGEFSAKTASLADGELYTGAFYTYTVDKSGNYQLTMTTAARQGWFDGTYYSIDPDAKNVLYPYVYNNTNDTTNNAYVMDLGVKPVTGKTVFITGDVANVGIQNTPKTKQGDNIYYLLDKDTGYIVAIYTAGKGSNTSSASEWYYVYGGGGDKNKGATADGEYYAYDAVNNGKRLRVADNTSLQASEDVTKKGSIPGLYLVNSYTDGYADLDNTKGGYYMASDVSMADNLVYCGTFDVSLVTYKDGILSLGNNVYYNINPDAKLYRLSANSSGQSVSGVSTLSWSGLKGGLTVNTSKTYHAYLVMSEENKNDVILAYFVKLGD